MGLFISHREPSPYIGNGIYNAVLYWMSVPRGQAVLTLLL